MAAASSRNSVVEDASDTCSGLSSNLREAIEEDCLQCPVCKCMYDQQMRVPKLLSCSHTLCLLCLTQLVDVAPERHGQDKNVKCPYCRVQMILSSDRINNVHNDHTIVKMLDVLSRSQKDVCSKHDQQKLQFFCEKCEIPVCRDCTVVDHKESAGHMIINASEAWTKYSPQFDDIERSSCELLKAMKRRSEALTTYLNSVCESAPSAKAQINDTFFNYRQILDQWERDLTVQLDQQAGKRKEEICSRRKVVQKHIGNLTELLDESKCFRSRKDLLNMLDTQKKIRELNTKCTQMATDREENLHFCHFSFSGPDTNLFLKDQDHVGKITCAKPPIISEDIEVWRKKKAQVKRMNIDGIFNPFLKF